MPLSAKLALLLNRAEEPNQRDESLWPSPNGSDLHANDNSAFDLDWMVAVPTFAKRENIFFHSVSTVVDSNLCRVSGKALRTREQRTLEAVDLMLDFWESSSENILEVSFQMDSNPEF